MKKSNSAFLSIFLLALLTKNSCALPKYGVSMLKSPNNEFTLKLADTKDPWTYELKIFRDRIQLAPYSFQGELLNAFWSPSLKFVAGNNHHRHGGYYVWIVSLADGSIVTSHGAMKARDYHRYLDDNNFVNLREEAAGKLKQIDPQVDTDDSRNGYDSVAYGWKGDGQLLMIHEFGFDNFYTKYHLIIQAFTTWNVTAHNVNLENIRFRKARDDQHEPMPKEAKKTLNFVQ